MPMRILAGMHWRQVHPASDLQAELRLRGASHWQLAKATLVCEPLLGGPCPKLGHCHWLVLTLLSKQMRFGIPQEFLSSSCNFHK